ncbi:PhzF family phenazine biosynthesis protein [Rodentibacter myodis]|uniref:Isomerase n=1 Tax=Rodentibacter myodis TaxID=1907939 RepID=A0A1V3JPT4_9PAST|nr:PhzF family phenazine biosynthesis protein [Rodentibacter myodis]OOF58573.1 isomerase [Rodentibacter myodis]
MTACPFYLLNVFAETHFGGNPLAVFPYANDLTDRQMQLIARQFNLSETVFIQDSTIQSAVKKLRIFTPTVELPFAGHPTLGASFVIRHLFCQQDHYQLETLANLVEIQHRKSKISLILTCDVKSHEVNLSKADIASVLGLQEQDIAGIPVWVNTGTCHLLVQVSNRRAVKNCQVSTALFNQKLTTDFALKECYIWFEQQGQVNARMFFEQYGAVLEDPGTGSAAANLGGWYILQQKVPIQLAISQGDELGRPNRLSLQVDEQQRIWVGGNVIEVAKGEFILPPTP